MLAEDDSRVAGHLDGASKSTATLIGRVILVWAVGSSLAVAGALLGWSALTPSVISRENSDTFIKALANWDGRWYASIVREGYSYTPDVWSNVAFFPVFPLAARGLTVATGLSAEAALVCTAYAFSGLSLLLMALYARIRFPSTSGQLHGWVLISMAFFPTTMFLRVAYSESTFLCFTLLTVYGIAKKWPAVAVACCVALTTAARPVGFVLLAPFMAYLWRSNPTPKRRFINFALLLPVACSGLLIFTVFLWMEFGDPLAWAKAQQTWRIRPDAGVVEKVVGLTALQPLWSVYDPSSPCYWCRPGDAAYAVFSMRFWNPVYMVVATVSLAIGQRRKWLNTDELIVGIALIFVPFATRGFEMCMDSQGRFVAVVFPMYLVLGQLLARIPAPVATALVAVSAFMMAIHAGMFAAGYVVI